MTSPWEIQHGRRLRRRFKDCEDYEPHGPAVSLVGCSLVVTWVVMRMAVVTATRNGDINGGDGHGGAMRDSMTRDSRNPTSWDLEDSRS